MLAREIRIATSGHVISMSPDGRAGVAVRQRGKPQLIDLNSGRTVAELSFALRRTATSLVGFAVFSPDSERWGYRARYLAGARPDQQGTFSIKGLPAGQYLAVAVDYAEQGEIQDPEFLESVRAQATRVTLAEAATQDIVLRVIKRP